MSPFEGFKNSDFDFFLLYDENADYKPVVKKRLTDFAALVHKSLPQKLSQAYPETYTGRFTKEGVLDSISQRLIFRKYFWPLQFELRNRAGGIVLGGGHTRR